MKEITDLSIEDVRRILSEKFGSRQLFAELLEDYVNTAGIEGFYATYHHAETQGSLNEILLKVQDWLCNELKHTGKIEFGLFKRGIIFKHWCIDLVWGLQFGSGSNNYYVKLST